jgi:hypothetical protein
VGQKALLLQMCHGMQIPSTHLLTVDDRYVIVNTLNKGGGGGDNNNNNNKLHNCLWSESEEIPHLFNQQHAANIYQHIGHTVIVK